MRAAAFCLPKSEVPGNFQQPVSRAQLRAGLAEPASRALKAERQAPKKLFAGGNGGQRSSAQPERERRITTAPNLELQVNHSAAGGVAAACAC